MSSTGEERADVVSRRRRGWVIVYFVVFAALCYLGTVAIHYLLGRTDIWIHGIAGLGPVMGAIAVEWWKRRRRRHRTTK
ncbi:hypothetical protein [Amycolatopsis sp. cmx-4-54]|uniref:hypothetical protein n=1 Tax=Amycolatopsis sp. cmx-4-54 TaxID=2790936 RepID=UPI00397B3496